MSPADGRKVMLGNPNFTSIPFQIWGRAPTVVSELHFQGEDMGSNFGEGQLLGGLLNCDSVQGYKYLKRPKRFWG